MQLELPHRLDQKTLEQHLWGAADILRGAVDAADFKNYILGLLFYKRLSDVYDEEMDEFKEKVRSLPNAEQMARQPQFHRFQIPVGFAWGDIRQHSTDIGAWLNKALQEITSANGDLLKDIFTRVDFNDKESVPDHKLNKLIQHFSRYNLGNKSVSADMLGDTYIYLIKQFASGAGKKGGEFFTPPGVAKLLVELTDPHEGASVYDPTCGSGSILVESVLHVRRQGGNVRNLFLRGQEINTTTYPIARMNMLLHDLDADIRLGDSIRDPKFLTETGALQTFDFVMANPPFSLADWGYDELKTGDPYKRFHWGDTLPPRTTGDMAFIAHIAASLKPGGRAAVVMPHGVLFRSGAEKKIRQAMIEADIIEAVVGLPNKLFFGTGIPGSIIVLNKQKPEERAGKILFIYGNKDYQEGKNQNSLRDQDIAKITGIFRTFTPSDKYSAVADATLLAANGYNLNITRYVNVAEEGEEIDVNATLATLRNLETERNAIDERLAASLRQLGYNL